MTYDFKDLSVAVIDESPYIARVTVSMLRVLEIRDIKTFTEVDELLAALAQDMPQKSCTKKEARPPAPIVIPCATLYSLVEEDENEE